MGHISPQVSRKLVQSGVMVELEVDMLSQATFCKACTKAKPVHKALPQKWEGQQATTFGEKVHLDVWGPMNPQSYDGKEYFITFTDDHNQ